MTLTDDPQSLQFETAIPSDSQLSHEAAVAAMTCRNCGQVIADEYFDVNGVEVCASCRDALDLRREPPKGAMPLVRAALFGFGAAIAGAALYYAVIAITDFEIGIVSIAIGYMVGYAIQKATGGRGGRAFQVLALVLTYWAVGLAYVPIVISAAAEADAAPAQSETNEPALETAAPTPSATASTEGESVSPLMVAVWVLGFSFALPVVVVFGSLPGGLLSAAAIISFGMHQAWRMTASPNLTISGPFRVGAAEPSLT